MSEAKDAVQKLMQQAHGRRSYDDFNFDALGGNYPTNASREGLYDRLANQFDDSQTGFTLNPIDAFRRWNRPSEQEAAATVAGLDNAIETQVARVNALGNVPGEVDPQLLRAVMHMEVRYNPDIGSGGQTKGIMNVSHDAWGDLLNAHGVSERDLTHGGTVGTPPTRLNADEVGIFAGALILSHLDAVVPESFQGADRAALIASMYANTELTMEAGRPIMHGGKTLEVMEARYAEGSMLQGPAMARGGNAIEVCQAPSPERMAEILNSNNLQGLLSGVGVSGDQGEMNLAQSGVAREVADGVSMRG